MTDHTQEQKNNALNPENSQSPKQPVRRIGEAGINAAIWENKSKNGTFYNVTISRSYKDQEGNYQKTDNFRKQDLPVLLEFTREAYNGVRQLEHQSRNDRQLDQPQKEKTDREAFKAQRSAEQQQKQTRLR